MACGTVPLYRLFRPEQPWHNYTTSEEVRDAAVKNNGYVYEGVTAYIFPA